MAPMLVAVGVGQLIPIGLKSSTGVATCVFAGQKTIARHEGNGVKMSRIRL